MNINSIIGLPWQLVEPLLRAASIPFTVQIGNNYNTYFSVSSEGLYVGRVKMLPTGEASIVLYYPMVYSSFEQCAEVIYAEKILEK